MTIFEALFSFGMSRQERRTARGRIAGSYVSSVLCISLVLFLAGVACLLSFNAGNVSDYFKESMRMSVLFRQDVTDEAARRHCAEVSELPYVKSAILVTREEGTEEMKKMLGEDFLNVFKTSPIPVSMDLGLEAEYVSPDSLAMVSAALSGSPLVDEVVVQKDLVEGLDSNLRRLTMTIGVFILLLLFISIVLINNTIRLNVYDRRFSIRAMLLVGATSSFIRAPFLKAALVQGLAASVLSLLFMGIVLFALKTSFSELFSLFSTGVLALTAVVVVAGGVLVCVVCTWYVTGKVMSLKKDKLYY